MAIGVVGQVGLFQLDFEVGLAQRALELRDRIREPRLRLTAAKNALHSHRWLSVRWCDAVQPKAR
ncbi:MAG: hypothetical protein AMK73_06730 [Planctomycetes bacterium SM23_32]|nr:MAG: hypothetical protein AMK73_06730 [Planctomycetes bacterium SM23_32]